MITDFRKSSTISDGIINVSPGDCDTDNVIIVRTVISAIVKITVKKKAIKTVIMTVTVSLITITLMIIKNDAAAV